MLERMAGSLTSLDLSGCGLEELPLSLLHPLPGGSDSDGDDSSSSGGGGIRGHAGSPLLHAPGGGGGAALPAAAMGGEHGGAATFNVGAAAVRRGPRLLRLLAHGNQLEASALHGGHELLWLPP